MNKMLLNFNTVITGKIIRTILILLTTILVGRFLGPEGKGVFMLITILPTLAVTFGNIGLNNSNTFWASKDKENIQKLFYSSFWLSLFLGLTFTSLFVFASKMNVKVLFGNLEAPYIIMLGIIIPFVLSESLFQGIIIGQKNFGLFNAGQISVYLIITIGIIIGKIFFTFTTYYLAVITTIALMCPAILYLIQLWKQFGIKWYFNWTLIKKCINFGFRSYLVTVMSYLIWRSDIYFVNIFLNMREVGLYSVAVNFADAIVLISNAIGLVLFPQIAANPEGGLKITLKITRLLFALLIVVSIAIFIFAKPFIILFFGLAFQPSILSVYILTIAAGIWSITSILSLYFASQGFPWKTVWIWFPGLIINVLINIIFLPKYGLIVAAISSLIAYGITLILCVSYLHRFHQITLKDIIITNRDEIGCFVNTIKKTIINFHHG